MTQQTIFDGTKKTASSKLIRLSPSTGLNLYRECPRCFWLHHTKGIHRPRGIFPSLPSGMDLVIKEYMDSFRRRDELPPELTGQVEGKLMTDLALMNKWRNWRTGMEYQDETINAVLFGALDECLYDNGNYIVLDYKTKGSAPKEGDSERYYQTQLDVYTLLLSANGYPTKNLAYLLYYYPHEVKQRGEITFRTKVVSLKTDPARAKKIFREAVGVLRGPIPKRHSNCEYCTWNHSLNEFD